MAPDEAVGPLDWEAAGVFGVTSHFGAFSECRTGNSNSTQSRNPVMFRLVAMHSAAINRSDRGRTERSNRREHLLKRRNELLLFKVHVFSMQQVQTQSASTERGSVEPLCFVQDLSEVAKNSAVASANSCKCFATFPAAPSTIGACPTCRW
jgi:hypothetical protein